MWFGPIDIDLGIIHIVNGWQLSEFIILIIIMGWQFVHTISVKMNLNIFKNVFADGLKLSGPQNETEDKEYPETLNQKRSNEALKITLVETAGKNEIIIRIKNAINNYLINNYGAVVNFSIIKDIIDREIDVKDEEISQSVPTPLYLGLAATMMGIIFGLFSMPAIDGTNFTGGINALIDGVKLAMIASLFGLACTTILSSFYYKSAKSKVLSKKNEQLSYLQAKLLPELIKAEDTGVSGLKQSLDRFAREATNIVESVKSAALNTGSNIRAQQNVLERVERLDMTRVSKVNLELFDHLEKNMDAFHKFSDYLSTMKDISNNLKEFALRTTAIDNVAQNINSAMIESKDLTKFLTLHLKKIESSGNEALKAVNFSDSYFREAIEKLTVEVDDRISKLNSSADTHHSELRDIYEKIGKDLDTITSQHLDEFKAAYAGAVPHFEQLDKLNELAPIKLTIENNANLMKKESSTNNHNLIESINALNNTIKQLKQDINNTALANRLDSIEKYLKKGKSTTPPKEPELFDKPKKIKNGWFRKLLPFGKNGKQKSEINNNYSVPMQ